MIRNSTHKYRERYEKSLPKNVHSTTFLHSDSTATLLNIDSARKTMPFIQHISTSKKLQTIDRNKKSKICQYLPPEKVQNNKLKKKSILQSLKGQNIAKDESCGKFQGYSTADKSMRNPDNDHFGKIQRDPETFIEELPKNSIFFCCKCYQYIFQIEKKRHFPECKDLIRIVDRKNEQFERMADQRIKNIVQLARYTGVKTKEIEQLYILYEEGKNEEIVKIAAQIDVDFFKLEEIVHAFHYTFKQLLKGNTFHQKRGLFNCF